MSLPAANVQLPVEFPKQHKPEGHDASPKTIEPFSEDFLESRQYGPKQLLEESSNTAAEPLHTFWNFFCSFVAPLLVQSVFGGFYIVRTLFLGYALQYSAQLLSLTETTAIQFLGKSATPPPALLGLALLTIAAFIIHPDGFTWILLRKLRTGLIFIIESSSTCWAVAVNDYGTVVSSALALLTFAGLIFIVYMMQRTLSSKTPQHRARHPVSDKQKRKKRKNKVKGRIRNSQMQASLCKDDEDESVDGFLIPAEEPVTSALPPLVEDKPVLEKVPAKTQVAVNDDSGASCERRDSFDSNFEDASSCETSVSSASVATPNRLLNPVVEHKEYKSLSNAKRRAKVSIHSTTRQGEVRIASNQEKVPAATTPSRWDALKPTSRSERFVPAQRTAWLGRNEARGNRRARKQNPTPTLSVNASSVDSSLLKRHATPMKTASSPLILQTTEREPARCTKEDEGKHHVEMGLNPESPPWNPIAATSSARVIAPPPGLDRIHSKEIPFGCGSSDGDNSAPQSPIYQDLKLNKDRTNPGDRSFFGAIGPSIPSADTQNDCTSSFLNESFSTTSTSFRSSLQPLSGNPFESYASNDDDKIEAQLQELGGQMVGSILDF